MRTQMQGRTRREYLANLTERHHTLSEPASHLAEQVPASDHPPFASVSLGRKSLHPDAGNPWIPELHRVAESVCCPQVPVSPRWTPAADGLKNCLEAGSTIYSGLTPPGETAVPDVLLVSLETLALIPRRPPWMVSAACGSRAYAHTKDPTRLAKL